MGEIDPHFDWLREDLSGLEERVTRQMIAGHTEIKAALVETEVRTNVKIDKLESRIAGLERFRIASSIAVALMLFGVLKADGLSAFATLLP